MITKTTLLFRSTGRTRQQNNRMLIQQNEISNTIVQNKEFYRHQINFVQSRILQPIGQTLTPLAELFSGHMARAQVVTTTMFISIMHMSSSLSQRMRVHITTPKFTAQTAASQLAITKTKRAHACSYTQFYIKMGFIRLSICENTITRIIHPHFQRAGRKLALCVLEFAQPNGEQSLTYECSWERVVCARAGWIFFEFQKSVINRYVLFLAYSELALG